MKNIRLAQVLLVTLIIAFAGDLSEAAQKQEKIVNILILSGSSNHEWNKTTPLLTRILNEANLFATQVSDNPGKLTYADFKKYDVIISNFNFYPDNNKRLGSQWEADFVRFVKEGGGALFFHAGSSSFYDWEEYRQISIGRWGKETFHNAPVIAELTEMDQKHPITKGMKGFRIMDEIWEKTELILGAKSIGSLTAMNAKDGHPINEPAIFVNQTGKGRSFFTILGHDERTLVNSGFRALLIRASQWCAGRAVTFKPPVEISTQKIDPKPQYSWNETDTTFTLLNHKEIVWQFNYNNRFQRPYFHPLTVNNTLITCVSPPDHPWHLGAWFSWKYINHLNYWEYLNDSRSASTGYKSEGSTEIVGKKIVRNPDFTSDITLYISYHPLKDKTGVLSEVRHYHVTVPDKNGSFYIDHDHLFTVLADSVVLDRTPPATRGGRTQGGYAGLSVRFSQDFTSPIIRNPADSAVCRKCNWQYYGFQSLTGKRVGMKIELDPQNTPESSSWYVINDPVYPFFFYSPAVIFDHPLVLKKGAVLHLKYKIRMIEGEVN